MNNKVKYPTEIKSILKLVISIILLSLFCSSATVSAYSAFDAEGKYIIHGAPIKGSNGIYFDSNNMLHIASISGREIVVMNPETGEILERLGVEKGIEGPDDLIIGPDGSIYWTSLMTGEVGRLSPEGVKTGQFVAPGVNPITFSENGRLFVALDFLGDALYEVDPDLQNPPQLISENLGSLNGMDFGPDGLLYGPLFTQGRVVRIDIDKEPFTMETVADGFFVPSAVKFDSTGRLYVVDFTGQVIRIDTETSTKEVIATNLPGTDNLAFDSNDRLYVSNTIDGSIKEILPDGEIRIVSEGGIILAGGVTIHDDSLYMADLFSLRKFDSLTLGPESIENYLFIPGMITSPITVASDENDLILSSWFTNEVQVWNPETGMVVESYLDFAVPLNAIRFQGDLIVSELGTGSVVRQSTTERVTFPSDNIYVPAGLAASDDDLWVGDWATGIVWQLVADGVTLSDPIPIAFDLVGPEGLVLDHDGTLLVVESGAGRITRIDPSTGIISTIMENLEFIVETTPGTPPTGIFNGIAVSQSGVIYVSGDEANSLTVLNYPNVASSLSEQVTSLEVDKTTLESQLTNLEDETTSLENEKTTLENQVSNFEDEISAIEEEKTTLRDQVSSQENSLASWRNITIVAFLIGIVIGAAIIYLRNRV